MADRTPRTHAVVIGASVGGLLAARALAECFERVTVLERETLPTGPEPRKRVPRGHHIHLLLRGGADAVETLYPGFFEELVQRGGVSVDFSTTEGSWFQHGVWKRRPLEHLVVSLPDTAISGATLANAPGCHSRGQNCGTVRAVRLEMNTSPRPSASFRPNLQILTEPDFIRPNNQQNDTYKMSRNWDQAILNYWHQDIIFFVWRCKQHQFPIPL